MKKKIILVAASALSVLALAGCSSTGADNTTIATMKGSTIKATDFYQAAKTDSSSKQVVFDMIISKVFNEKYGDLVTDKDVKKDIEKRFGDDFEDQLKAAGLTREAVEQNIKDQLVFQAGLKSHVKLTKADLKSAWESFHPEVKAKMIMVYTEEDAKSIEKKLAKKEADFGKIAAENSVHASKSEDGDVTFDSASTDIPDTVKQAAFALKDGETSEIIPVANQSTGITAYYIVKMVKNQDKGNDMDKYKEEIEEIATNAKLNDSNFTTKVIGEELIEANVKIKDETFATILTNFIDAAKETTESSTATSETAAE